MKPPSAFCLRVLNLLITQPNPAPTVWRRCYAKPAHPRAAAQRAIPAQTLRATPPAPTAAAPPSTNNPSLPHGQSSLKRPNRNDDEEFVPQPLDFPLGMSSPPRKDDNKGIDKRTLKQRRDDFVNYDKHLEKRERMKDQMSKPYYRDWSNLRYSEGKIFVANERLFRDIYARYFPNFFGVTLLKNPEREDRTDGYKGAGKSTCVVMDGKISITSITSNTWAADQVDTFCSKENNPELHEIMSQNPDLVQRVEINYEDDALKYLVMGMFGFRSLRKQRSLEQQARYFVVRRGVSDEMKEAIGMLNEKVGYVYLVDQKHRIRWAGSANATDGEKQSMVVGLKKLIREARAASDGPSSASRKLSTQDPTA